MMITVKTLLKDPLLSRSLLASKPVHKLTPLQLWLFIWQQKRNGREAEARQVVKQLLRRIKQGITRGEFSAPHLHGYQLPEAPAHMACHELAAMLARISPVRRKALLFTVDANIPPDEAICLHWSEVNQHWYDLPELSRSILLSLPRHIATPLVFWESSRTKSWLPLIDLCVDLENMGLTWEQLKQAADTARCLESGEVMAVSKLLTEDLKR